MIYTLTCCQRVLILIVKIAKKQQQYSDFYQPLANVLAISVRDDSLNDVYAKMQTYIIQST